MRVNIEKEVELLINTFKNIYFNIDKGSLVISIKPINIKQLGHISVSKENEQQLVELLDNQVNLRWGYGFCQESPIIEIYLGNEKRGCCFDSIQTLSPTTEGLVELIAGLFEDLT